MRNVPFIIAGVLIIVWVIGVFACKGGGVIHLLLFIAFFTLLLRVIRKKRRRPG